MRASETAEGAKGWNGRRERVARGIERAALVLFAKERSEDVTVEQIAEAAGISMRTYFRYFAGRDDVLAALPMRKLETISTFARARPPEETLVEALSGAVAAAQASETELDMILLWGVAVHRSPDAALKAMTHSALSLNGVFQALVAERLGVDESDPKAGALGAAISGLVAFAFSRWVSAGGAGSLAQMLTESFAALAEFR